MIAGLYRRFAKSERANVAVIFSLALVPMVYLTGMGVDYTLAVDREAQLNAAADAAALSAVTPTMMAGPSAPATGAGPPTSSTPSPSPPMGRSS